MDRFLLWFENKIKKQTFVHVQKSFKYFKACKENEKKSLKSL